MGKIAWTRGEGPLVPIADGYRRELVRLGYSPNYMTIQLVLIGQLNRWLCDGGLTVGELTPDRAEEFFAARRARGQRRVPSRSLVSLFAYLQADGVVPPPLPAPSTVIDELLGEYHHHLIHERGVTSLTALRYERMAR
ncbi:MAG TPA: hypothetical protein VMW62_18555, partial [Chloroflexota bacterium]|nr:hypothetical protein [Chloroflexota bacterium]